MVNRFKIAWAIFACIMLLPSLALAVGVKSDGATSEFIAVSDIHFNPMSECTSQTTACNIVENLLHHHISEWRRIFTSSLLIPEEPRYHDTGNQLFISVLSDLKQVVQTSHPRFILMNGDLFAHHIDTHFQFTTRGATQEQYSQFMYSTLDYISTGLAHATHLPVIPVVGNTDTDRSDYDISAEFNRRVAKIWVRNLGTLVNPVEFLQSFAKGGYYRVDLPNSTNKLLVLNTVLFSLRGGQKLEQSAITELRWLENQLQLAQNNHYHVWLAMHIPPGIDLYKQSHDQSAHSVIEFWKVRYKNKFNYLVTQYPGIVTAMISGHEHNDLLRVLDGVPLITVPSISPIFGNNPAYKIMSYNNRSLDINDIRTRYLPLQDGLSANVWVSGYDFNKLYRNHQALKLSKIIQLIAKNKTQFLLYAGWLYEKGKVIAKKELPYYNCGILSSQNANDYQTCVKEASK